MLPARSPPASLTQIYNSASTTHNSRLRYADRPISAYHADESISSQREAKHFEVIRSRSRRVERRALRIRCEDRREGVATEEACSRSKRPAGCPRARASGPRGSQRVSELASVVATPSRLAGRRPQKRPPVLTPSRTPD